MSVERDKSQLNEKLWRAAKYESSDTVLRLIQEGAEVSSKDRYGDTGLHFSAYRGDESVMRTFLEHGIDINIRGASQKTALMDATWGHYSCVQILLERGANLDLKDKSGETALMKAAKYDFPDNVGKLLAGGADAELKDNEGVTAECRAKLRKNHDVTKMFEVWTHKDTLNQEMITAAEKGKQDFWLDS